MKEENKLVMACLLAIALSALVLVGWTIYKGADKESINMLILLASSVASGLIGYLTKAATTPVTYTVEKEPEAPTRLGNSGSASPKLIRAVAYGWIAIAAVCFGMSFNGCASLPTESKLSVARIIARNAGYYMVDHHTPLAKRISTGYAAIEGADGAAYQEAIRALLSQALMDQGVRRSDRLLADAADILGLFGVALPDPDNVTLEWVQGLNIGNLRSVAEAFVEGLNSPVAPKVG